jgi:hypothetical protein
VAREVDGTSSIGRSGVDDHGRVRAVTIQQRPRCIIGVGDYALVRSSHPDAATGQSRGSTAGDLFGPPLLIVLGLLILVVIAVLAVRYARRSGGAPPPDPSD